MRMPSRASRSTRRTVIIAGVANLFVAAIKLAAGILAGSSAMLAEAAHSVADTLNQAFLLTSVHRAERPADRRHPFGYGQERYFWSLLAAFGIFIAGGGFSVFEGVLALGRSGSRGSLLIAYVVLGLSGLAECTSLIRAAWQTRAQARARHVRLIEHIRTSPDTTVKAAFFEDSVAIVGLVLAFAGLILRELTGSEVWDAAASMAIGVLLIIVAIRLGADNRDLLIGQAADADQLSLIRREIRATRGIAALLELLTMHLGPDCIIVAARVAFDDDISADQVEDLSDAIDARLAQRLSVAAHVFLDPTQLRPETVAPGAMAYGTATAGDLAADAPSTD
jgi:cation diffusion facilitator family transporter